MKLTSSRSNILTATLTICLAIFSLAPYHAQANQIRYGSTEAQFQELFITAGYSTAFGAALGFAAIGLTTNPVDNMRFIATGASVGFITGSLIGTYVILNPTVASSTPSPLDRAISQSTATQEIPSLSIQPEFDHKLHITGARANFVLTRF